MTRIILAEDHKIVRNGIRSILESELDFEIAGEAANGKEVLSLLESGVKTDIVLTDISMPEMDGITLSLMLSRRYPDVKVIVLSMMDNEKYIYDAFSNGVKGYLLKNTAHEELIFSIRHVARNNEIVCAELGVKMLRRAMSVATDTGKTVSYSDMTAREHEILALIAEGYTNSEIADKIFTSKRTVEGHRLNLINKTGVKNTAQLIKYACKAGLI